MILVSVVGTKDKALSRLLPAALVAVNRFKYALACEVWHEVSKYHEVPDSGLLTDFAGARICSSRGR